MKRSISTRGLKKKIKNLELSIYFNSVSPNVSISLFYLYLFNLIYSKSKIKFKVYYEVWISFLCSFSIFFNVNNFTKQ